MTHPATARKPRSATAPAPFTQPAPCAEDFLARLHALMLEHADPALVVAAVQVEWGGDRPYIRKANEAARAERSLRDRAIVRDHQRGESSALLSRRYGISRRRVEQLVRNALP